MSTIRNLAFILAGAAILLIPALVFGRPFVFYDTPVYWGWGRDVVEAFARPWPGPLQPWIPGRPLHGWELGAHGATSGDLRFILTAMSARSLFYAVPLYLLTSLGGLWLIAGLQSLLAAWTLRAALSALVPTARGLAYLALVTAMAGSTGLAFETAYIMPDVFAGLAVLAACVLAVRPDAIGPWTRTGLVGVIAYAALAHAANLPLLAAVAAFAILIHAREGWRAAARAAPVAGALALSLALGFGGQALLAHAFGRPLQPAPFLAARVLADGAGQRYLARVCPAAHLAACDLADVHAGYPEYYLALYPLAPPPGPDAVAGVYDRLQYRAVTDAEAAHREAFVAEEPRLVAGALLADGPRLIALRLADAAREVLAVAVAPDFDSLRGVARERTQRRAEAVAITPGAAACADRGCPALDLGGLAVLQRLIAWAAIALVAASLLRRAADVDALRPFLTLILFALAANALICGGLSGVYDRYQLRLAWLPVFGVAALVLAWAATRRTAATLRSPARPIIAAVPAERRS